MISAALLVDLLGIKELYSTEVSLAASGETEFSHGIVPLPVPAVTEILKGHKIRFVDEKSELVTPTGAAILVGLKTRIARLPEKDASLIATGFGAGTRV